MATKRTTKKDAAASGYVHPTDENGNEITPRRMTPEQRREFDREMNRAWRETSKAERMKRAEMRKAAEDAIGSKSIPNEKTPLETAAKAAPKSASKK